MIRSFFPYFGGKLAVAAHYPHPQYKTIIEPFAGGAGYSLLHHYRQIILVEKNPEIAKLWKWLITASEQQILKLPLLKLDQKIDELGLNEQETLLLQMWAGIGSSVRNTISKQAFDGKHAHDTNHWSARVRARISQQLPAIKHWTILEGDYTEAPSIEATWFIDPPYFDKGKFYKFSSVDLNFTNLAIWCKSRAGQVTVCEQVGAEWLPFTPFMRRKSFNGKGKNDMYSAEAIWTNTKIGFFS